jgi:large subunit ribosomal protein L4e
MATAAARPLVQVWNGTEKSVEQVPLPAVLTAPIRQDIVQFVHSNIAKNRRQPYSVSEAAGHQTSAISWGTGRAVARIPRVSGSGTHRAGQGAFGNMCRGGRMFAPTKIWRRWHRKVNINTKRFAVASALAASAVPALVMARGHRIEGVNEIPLVISNESVKDINKTKDAVAFLKSIHAFDDVQHVKDTKKIRAGKGKARNRRYVLRRGPLVIYNEKGTVLRALRNLPGVEFAQVGKLNLLDLAPGGHLGRFVIWTKDAFEKWDSIFGTPTQHSEQKTSFNFPRSVLSNADLGRLLKSDEVRSVLRSRISNRRRYLRKKNPLKNLGALVKLNPYAIVQRRRAILENESNAKKNIAARADPKKAPKRFVKKAKKPAKKTAAKKTAAPAKK